jgi:hypothetical protein
VRDTSRVIGEDRTLSGRALNRALLARQGLLEPYDGPVVGVVEAIGALQAQQWPAVPGALRARMASFDPTDLYAALSAGELVVGTSIRRTLHLVSAREHPRYAAAAVAGGADHWRRSKAEPTAEQVAATGRLRAELVAFAARARTGEELAGFIEERVDANPGAFDPAELAEQRQYGWRPFYTCTALVRAPADGAWSARTPSAYRAAPHPPAGAADAAHEAGAEPDLAGAVRCHLRAFGPSAADDVATWLGLPVPPARRALERMAGGLETFADEAGRTLYDLPDAPRPGADAAAPVRFLPAFDSTLLAYAHRHRGRILPSAYKDRVYARANLRINPTVLVDGLVAGLWSARTARRVATVTVTPFASLDRAARAAVVAEAERLARAAEPKATAHEVVVE